MGKRTGVSRKTDTPMNIMLIIYRYDTIEKNLGD